jgi:hypothetical protein
MKEGLCTLLIFFPSARFIIGEAIIAVIDNPTSMIGLVFRMNQSLDNDDDDEGNHRVFPSTFVIVPEPVSGRISRVFWLHFRVRPIPPGTHPLSGHSGMIAG